MGLARLLWNTCSPLWETGIVRSRSSDLTSIQNGKLRSTWLGVVVCCLGAGFGPRTGLGAQEKPALTITQERPVILAVRFLGNEKFSEKKLRSEVSVKVGDPVDRFSVRDGREAITAKYREAGYSDVVVTVDEELLGRTGELLYRIEEGPRTRIRRIVFDGNESFPDRVLKRQIESKTALWILRTGTFDSDQADGDVARLQNYYRDRGFLDVRVSYRREVTEDGAGLTLIFTVEEGARYAIEEIQFRGNILFSAEELLSMMTSAVGETVKPPLIDLDARTIQTRYGELGHIYANVEAIRVFSDTPGLVRLTLDVREGEQYRVGEIRVRGNLQTRDKVVRRALNLYPPDDLFNLTEAREAERRLIETRIFSSARVLPVGDAPGRRDVVIDVQEAGKTGDFLFGFGVTSNSGLVGNIVLDLKNFDLFDRPRSFWELVKFQSFVGGGQHLRLELQPGTDVNRFRLQFTEPYLMDKPVRFDAGLYLFDRGRDGYVEERVGGTVSLGKRFERGRLQGWSAELALRVESATVDGLDLFASREIREDRGSNLMTSAKVTLARDRTDSRFVPSSGDRLRIGYEQYGVLGGDHDFGRLTAGYTWYKTLRTDLQERKGVLKLRAEGGVIVGDAPVFERFYAGGTGTIRGFEFRGVGPRDGLEDNNVGGDFLVLLGGEYSFPLIGDNIRGLFFIDSGAVGSGTYRASIGAGVRLTIDLLGPLPLEFDLALPFLADSDDDQQVFSFLIGGLF